MDKIIELLTNSMLLNNIVLIIFLGIFIFAFWKENNNSTSPVRWIDLVIKDNKLSLSRFGQLLGYFLSSWIVIYLAQVPAAYPYYPFIFLTWLAYTLGSYSFNKWLEKANVKGKEE